jgi:hypothetical protein
MEENIKQQVAWLDRRNFKADRLGTLCRSIEDNWPEPHRLDRYMN